MLRNNDGNTLYELESVLEHINDRSTQQDWPYLSDILGSDWGANFKHPDDTEGYIRNAYKMAARIYPNPAGIEV